MLKVITNWVALSLVIGASEDQPCDQPLSLNLADAWDSLSLLRHSP